MLEEGVFYNQRVLLGKLLGFALLHLYSTAKLAHYSRYLLTSYFCIPVPYDEKDIFFGVISKRSFSVIEPLNFTFSGISGWSIDLDYCNLEWSADEQEIILSFFRMHPSTPFWNIFFFYYEGYCISSERFLPAIIDMLLLSHFSHVQLCHPIDGSPPGSPLPWHTPGKNTGVGCHFLLQCMKVKSESDGHLN